MQLTANDSAPMDRFGKSLAFGNSYLLVYNQLGSAVHSQGPLEEKTRDLVKLGIAIGIGSEGAVHSHPSKALASGVTPEVIRQVVLL